MENFGEFATFKRTTTYNYLMYVVQSNLAIKNFLFTLKLFLNAKCSLSQTFNQSTIFYSKSQKSGPKTCHFFSWKWYLMKNQGKIVSFLQSIISLVPKGFHKMCASHILCKTPKLVKKILKSPFLIIFTISCSLFNAKFCPFLDWQKFLI